MIGNSWDNVLEEEFKKEYFLKIKEFVEAEYKTKTIYPPKDEIFNAFKLCPIDNVKVVILGQDPYHEKGQAHGLSFSTPEGHPIPRSLKNIFKEIESDYGYPIPDSGYSIYPDGKNHSGIGFPLPVERNALPLFLSAE